MRKCTWPLAALMLLTAASPTFPWGPEAHKIATSTACDVLRGSIGQFFKDNREFLLDHCNEPDDWAYDGKHPEERYQHYIDLDLVAPYPFDDIPRDYAKFEAKLKEKELTVADVGRVPWRIEERYRQLTGAFREKDWEKVKHIASHLAHYVEDASQPLHSTKNYDGQFSGNRGVHGRFEADMIRHYLDEYSDLSGARGAGAFIKEPVEFAFQVLIDSYVYVDNIMRADTQAHRFGETYDAAYYERLHGHVGWIAKRRLGDAATAVASLWLSAWIEAGKPELPEGEN
ncbi:MAG: hypothetical protein PVH68_01120 [Armatimonadota bacterium]